MGVMSSNQAVRLRENLPDLGLSAGESGVVCSSWFAPTVAYEVEFRPGMSEATRVLLLESQLELIETR